MNELNIKKIAVAFPTCSTGGAKYLYLLLKSIVKLKPNYQIKIWHDMKDEYAKKLIYDTLSPLGIEFEGYDSREFVEKKKSSIKFINKMINDYRKFKKTFVGVNPKLLNQYDLLFCPWPYDFTCPDVNIPIVCVPHDFNYTHHFGMNTYGYEHALRIKKQHQSWFEKATPIVSTNFMAKELKNTFPELDKEVKVAHLSMLNDFKKIENEKVDKILSDLGIDFDYVLIANNSCYHKNFNILYGGYYHLKEKYPNLKLVMVGHGTEGFRGKSNSAQCIDMFNENPDVLGLGLVSDEVLVALMQRTKAVINSSLYEAGNGSGLDAWGLGIPVAMSDIPSFREQIEILGVKAQLFDPQSSRKLAQAVVRIIENPEQTQKDVETSLNAINNYSWEKVAQKYIDIFENIMNGDIDNIGKEKEINEKVSCVYKN